MPDLEQENQDTVVIDEGVSVSSPDTPETDVTPAEDEGPANMAEAVEAALKEEGEPSSPTSEDAKGEGDGEPAPKADADAQKADEDPSGTEDGGKLPEGDPTEEELKDYSQKANARIRDLVSQRNEAQQRADAVQPFVDFVKANDIPGEDLDIMLDLTAKLRHGDFGGFLQGIAPYINLAQQYTGQVLPPDLQEQVKKGFVSPAIAKELAQSRARVQVGESNLQTQRDQNARNNAEVQATAVRSAIMNWEKQVQQSDPDYALKAEMIRRTSQAMMAEHGSPRNADEALQLVQVAYEEVNKQTQGFRPAPKATANAPRSTGQQGGSAPTAEPKSMMDAAMQALDRARA